MFTLAADFVTHVRTLSFFFFTDFSSVFCIMTDKEKRGEKRKRTNLTISAKLELLKKLDSGYSVAKVCEEYGVKKQTVSDIRKARGELEAFAVKFDVSESKGKSGIVHKRKHTKVCSSKDLEEALFKWYTQERSVKVNVRGTDLLDAACKLAKHMGIEFSGSTGWLWRFRKRHGIGNKKKFRANQGAPIPGR